MFSSPTSTIESHNYDFEKAENAAKWKGVFVNSLRKVGEKSNTFVIIFVVVGISNVLL